MMCAEKTFQNDEFDINNVFTDIMLSEEHLSEKSYEDGFQRGCEEGNCDGYRLGYEQGLELGKELGNIYGMIVAEQQNQHPERITNALKQLRKFIDEFPTENDHAVDIIGKVELIRSLYKKICAKLALSTAKLECKDLSY